MRKHSHWLAFTAICFLVVNLPAMLAGQSFVVLDFQSLQYSGTGFTNVGYIYKEKGFVVTGNGGVLGAWNTGASQYTGSTALFNQSQSYFTLSRDDGGQFNFLGIDLGPLDNRPPESGPITFTGYRDSELVVTQAFQFNGALGVQHFTPSIAFGNLTEVRWWPLYPSHQFDNVTVRSIGGALPLRVSIRPPNSVAILDMSHLHVGTSYTVQQSADFVTWTYVYDFTAYASTYAYYAPLSFQQESAFFRLLWTP